jgi:hypothetical protein
MFLGDSERATGVIVCATRRRMDNEENARHEEEKCLTGLERGAVRWEERRGIEHE